MSVAYTRKLATGLIGLALATTATVSQAAFIVANTNTMDNLVSGASISSPTIMFDNFASNSFQVGGAIPVDPSTVTVNAGTDSDTGQEGLEFLMGAAAGANQTLTWIIAYDVNASQPVNRITGILGGVSATGTGSAGFSETATTTPQTTLNVFLPPNLIASSPVVNPDPSFNVLKVVSLSGGENGIALTSSFYQLFQQVPEPATGLMGLFGTLAMLTAGRRRNN